ncbi:MAG: hypothetical protein OXB95_12855 [Rhodobacteraceae bacterium]|nr:hypothetical protein [Paracoccaceae bacterium]
MEISLQEKEALMVSAECPSQRVLPCGPTHAPFADICAFSLRSRIDRQRNPA